MYISKELVISQEGNVPDERHITFKGIANAVFLFFIFAPFIELFPQETHFLWEGVIREKTGAGHIPNASIRVFSKGRVFLFTANDKGEANIRYYRPAAADSILITSIGYKPYSMLCHELQQVKEILLEEDIYAISDVVITPMGKRKTLKLGNKTPFSIRGIGTVFNMQLALLIKYEETHGRILKIRYCMKNLPDMKTFHKPFRVRIYEWDTLKNAPGSDLLDECLIVSLNKGKWLEVDVSQYNIALPPKGVFVGMEVLPAEYYLSNDIIASKIYGYGKYDVINALSIGATQHSKKSNLSYESWECRSPETGWTLYHIENWDFMINIIVEKRK